MLEAVVSYTGVDEIFSFTYSIGHGVVPGVMSFQIAPQRLDKIAQFGTLKMEYDGKKWKMPNCLSDRASYQLNSSGEVVGFYASDFRWAWHYATVTGAFNVKDMEGNDIVLSKTPKKNDADLIGYSKRSLRELCEICLEAMGVEKSKRNVRRVPKNIYPSVTWDNDNAAQALHALLEPVGLRLCPTWKQGVVIAKAGAGAKLSDYDKLESFGAEIDPVQKPKKIVYISQPIRYNVDFPLEAVGEDIDGKILPVEQLSYWNDTIDITDPMKGFDELIPDEDKDYGYSVAALAEKCLFKWWRIQLPDINNNNNSAPPNKALKKFKSEFGDIKYIEQFLPLMPVQAETGIDAIEKRKYSKRPIVFGKFLDDGDIGELSVDNVKDIPWDKLDEIQIGREYDLRDVVTFTGMSLDAERGIVMFNDIITSQVSQNVLTAERPILFLRCGCLIKNVKTGVPVKYSKDRAVDKNSPADSIVIDVQEAQPYYGATDENSNNIDEVDGIFDKYDKEVDAVFDVTEGESATYIGLIKINLDGAIREVNYSVSESGATTVVMRNTDRATARVASYLRRTQMLETEMAKRRAEKQEALWLWNQRTHEAMYLR